MTNRLHLYYGTGKGKTTAAMGLAVRALGHERRVLTAQFMKSGTSGELSALRQLPGCEVYASVPVDGFVFMMTEEEKRQVISQQTGMALALAEHIRSTQPQLIVLDELAVACACGIVREEAAMQLIDTAIASGEVAVTGRDAPEWLRTRADYVSRIDAERHPYDTEQLQGREGIEW